MKSLMSITCLLIALLLHPALPQDAMSGVVSSGKLDAILQTRVRHYTLSADSFLQALTMVAGEFRIPMGIQWAPSREALTRINLTWTDSTVRDIIKSIAGTQVGYKVSPSSGIVHILPENAEADQRNFLNLKIKDFDVQGALFAIATLRLEELARQAVSRSRAGRTAPGTGAGLNIGSTPGEPLVTIHLEEGAVSQALDALTLHSDRKIWIVTFCDECGFTPTGFRRTIQLWTATVPTDDLQPVWNSFTWGEQIPSNGLRR